MCVDAEHLVCLPVPSSSALRRKAWELDTLLSLFSCRLRRGDPGVDRVFGGGRVTDIPVTNILQTASISSSENLNSAPSLLSLKMPVVPGTASSVSTFPASQKYWGSFQKHNKFGTTSHHVQAHLRREGS